MKKIFIFAYATSVEDDIRIGSLLSDLRESNVNIVAHGVCGFYMRRFGCMPMANIKNFYDKSLKEYFYQFWLCMQAIQNIKQHAPQILIINKHNSMSGFLINVAKKINKNCIVMDIGFKDSCVAQLCNADICLEYKLAHPLYFMPEAEVLEGSLLLHPGNFYKQAAVYLPSMLDCAKQLLDMQMISQVVIVVGGLKQSVEHLISEKYLEMPLHLLQHISDVRPKLALLLEENSAIEASILGIPYYNMLGQDGCLLDKCCELMSAEYQNIEASETFAEKTDNIKLMEILEGL